MKAVLKSNPYPPLADDIIREVYLSMELLRADKELLAIVGSWNETLPDRNVLAGLRFWIKIKQKELQQRSKSAKAGKG